MRILITGSSGQLGSYLVEHLAAEHDVTGLDIRPPPAGLGLEGMAEMVRGDIKDYRLAMELCRGKDVVVHAAAQVSVERSVSDPVFDAGENILGTINMLEAATKTMVGQFIYISSAAIFGEPVRVPIDEEHPCRPLSPYGASKLAGENYAMAFHSTYGLACTSIRPFNIYSQRQDPDSPYSGVITRFVEQALAGGPLTVHGDGSQTRDFVHVSDVVRMVGACLGNPDVHGQVLNCGTGRGTSILELAEMVAKLAGGEPEIVHTGARRGDIRHSVADIGRAASLLGYRPEMSLELGLRELMGRDDR